MLIRRKITYVIICILFVSYLLCSNMIIAAFKDNNVRNSEINILKYVKNTVYFGLDDINFRGDIFDSFIINGWVFCETNLDNSNKEVWIILNNDKSTYIHKADLIDRKDAALKLRENYKIKGANHGIKTTLSTVGVKNGIYKLYLYCKENEEDYGLADTGIMLNKNGGGISQYTWKSSLSNILETEVEKKAKGTIDSISINEGYLQILGWAFAEGLDTADQSVYVRIKDKNGETATYDTQNMSRPDVANVFKSSLYNNSGFKALISVDELNANDMIIEILVCHGEKVYLASRTYKYSIDADNKEEISDENNERSISTKIKIDSENIMGDSAVKYSIDLCSVDKNLVIKGWAFVDEIDSSKIKVYIGVTPTDSTTHYYTTAKVSRPDVAKVFDNEIYAESGFKAEIPLNVIAKGDNKITIIVDDGSLRKAVKQYTFTYE